MWFRLGCLCWKRSKDYFLWDTPLRKPISSKRWLLWHKNWYLGFRSLDLRVSVWDGSLFDNKAIRYGKDSKRSRPLPKLGSNIPITFIFNQMYAWKRSIKSSNPQPNPSLPSPLKLPSITKLHLKLRTLIFNIGFHLPIFSYIIYYFIFILFT